MPTSVHHIQESTGHSFVCEKCRQLMDDIITAVMLILIISAVMLTVSVEPPALRKRCVSQIYSMTKTQQGDIEGGKPPAVDQTQPAPDKPSQGESKFHDSSGQLFSIYYDTVKGGDTEMAERWQKDADGIIYFTGLFSASVAVLLSVTVQDLRPNSQDISAFYLGNIYEVLADPNATRSSIPFPVAKPPPFSPPRHAVWVNLLWFLSLAMGLCCALWATSLQQWARRYIRLTQPAQCNPEKQARTRAFFAKGVDKVLIPWAVEGLPMLLHLSLFLFFSGLAVFLFNIDEDVFTCVVWWIGLFSMVYVFATLLPLFRQNSPCYTPLSIPAWFPYASIHYLTFKFLAFITLHYGNYWTWEHFCDSRDRYYYWMSKSMEEIAGETASRQSLDIDLGILGYTFNVLGDDSSLEGFFEAIPGFFNSKLVTGLREHLPDKLSGTLSDALDGFLGRTMSSNLVDDKVKLHRLDISLSATNSILVSGVSSMLEKVFFEHSRQVAKPVEMGHTVARWCTSNDQRTAQCAHRIVARVLGTAGVGERNDRWVELAVRVYGLSEPSLRSSVPADDNSSLAIFIHVTRRAYRFDPLWDILWTFTQFKIEKTDFELQHHFCALWNEIVEEAKRQGPDTTPVHILRRIRHLYFALHKDAPTVFRLPTNNSNPILFSPLSYPSCNAPDHFPGYVPAQGPPSRSYPTKTSEIGDSSRPPAAPLPTLFCSTGNVMPRLRARGLVNSGNMCFANAVLQLLVHSPPFWKKLGDLYGQIAAEGLVAGGGRTTLVDATLRFFEEFVYKEEPPPALQQLQQAAIGKPAGNEEEKKKKVVDSFKPTYMYDAMKEKGHLKRLLNGKQHDAEKFLRLYLDALDEELLALLASISGQKSATAATGVEERQVSQSTDTDVVRRVVVDSVDSPLMRIFGGMFHSILRAETQPDTIILKGWRSLQLDIQHDSVLTIEDALKRISDRQTQLGTSGQASQQVLIEKLPPVLVLHLKRFVYDKATNSTVKISKSVQFAPELEIPPEIMASVDGKSAEPVHYKLYGVLYHRGESTGSGHYTVDVLHPNGDSGDGETWLHIDDEVVGKVELGSGDNERHASAYMLFYCRTAPSQTQSPI